ncbi:hypothetical protein FOL47_001208, partial [Perkinsus chesapeaki]
VRNSLNHLQVWSLDDRRRCGQCGIVAESWRELEQHKSRGCRETSDVVESVTEKKYYSQDCNCGPMLCVADSGESCPVDDPEWQEKVVKYSQRLRDSSQGSELLCMDSQAPVKRQIQPIDTVANRVLGILDESASQLGASDFLLVELQLCDATLSLALGKVLAEASWMPRNSTVSFVLSAEEKNRAILEETAEAIKSLHPSFLVIPVVTSLKDLCVDALFGDLSQGKQCAVVYSTHLCGADADLAMRSLSRSQGCTEERCASLVAASCCHYLCEWSHFVGRAPWMRHFNLTHTDFLGCVEASSWARLENATDDRRQAVGQAAIKLLDAARLMALKEADDYSIWSKREVVPYGTDQDVNIIELLVDDAVRSGGDRDYS